MRRNWRQSVKANLEKMCPEMSLVGTGSGSHSLAGFMFPVLSTIYCTKVTFKITLKHFMDNNKLNSYKINKTSIILRSHFRTS